MDVITDILDRVEDLETFKKKQMQENKQLAQENKERAQEIKDLQEKHEKDLEALNEEVIIRMAFQQQK